MSVDEHVLDTDAFKFKFPFGSLLCGPSQSGKTTFVKKLIKQRSEMFSPPPASVLYAYGEYTDFVDTLEQDGIHVSEGIPDESVLDKLPKPILFLIDDCQEQLDPDVINSYFSKKLHHRNWGIFLLVQSCFLPVLRVPKLNSNYLILLRSPAYRLQVSTLGRQLFPGKSKSFLKAYDDAVSQNWGYLVINLRSNSPPLLTLTTNIFENEDPIIYKI